MINLTNKNEKIIKSLTEYDQFSYKIELSEINITIIEQSLTSLKKLSKNSIEFILNVSHQKISNTIFNKVVDFITTQKDFDLISIHSAQINFPTH